jgi:hypothetical protein
MWKVIGNIVVQAQTIHGSQSDKVDATNFSVHTHVNQQNTLSVF